MTGPGIRHDASRSTVLRAVALLDSFRPDDVELGLADLAQRSGLPKSTAFRIVEDLITARYLEHGSSGYRLGGRLFEIGHLVPRHRRLRDIALPFLTDLHEITGLTANLAVRDGSEIVYVEKLVQRSSPVPHTRAGGRLPLHCTALGKAILAFSGSRVVTDLVAAPLTSLTSHTLTNPDALRSSLAETRRSGLAYDEQESEIGLICVASPIMSAHGPVAAISATGIRGRAHSRQVGLAVLTAGRALSREVRDLTADRR